MVIAPLASISTPQAALDARRTQPRGTLTIGGIITPALSVVTSHQRGQAATATIRLPLPRPAQIVANAAVEYQSGHNDLIGTTFSGYLPDWSFAMTERGDILTLTAAGWLTLMDEPIYDDIVYPGPVDAADIFADLCRRCGVPASIAEAALMPDGSPLMLGGNPQIDGGAVIIKAHSSPRMQLQRRLDPFRYYISDTGTGAVRLHRMLGEPDGDPVVTFAEGRHLLGSRRDYRTRGIVNAWKVQGPTYEDAYGGSVPVSSVADPATVPPHPEIRGGYRYSIAQNSDLVRFDLADAARQVLEITHGAAEQPVTWEAVAVPGLAPGDVVAIDNPTVEASARYWLVGIDASDDESGMTATYTAEIGAGASYPGIVDRVTVPVQTDVWHGGDEYVSHYKHPAPQGVEKVWTLTLPEDATAVNIRGYQHSWNSQTVAGENTKLTVSRWEVWAPGVDRNDDDNRAEASGTMPHMPERYYDGLKFGPFAVDAAKAPGDDGYVIDAGEWAPFAINLSRLDAGEWVLVFRCGEKAGYDDGEVIAVYLEAYGLTRPAGVVEVA